MKEIDFIPGWYRNDRKRQFRYRARYIALGCIFAVIVVWNFATAGSISKANAQIKQAGAELAEAEKVSGEFTELESRVKALQGKADLLARIDSKIDVANVLAEISYLLGGNVLLSKVQFESEGFAGNQNVGAVTSAVRAITSKEKLLFGDVRFKVIITGIAVNAGEVAELICRMEESPYFTKVYPLFSRNRQIKTGTGRGQHSLDVSEFEIKCYLANYIEK